jgi:hypothetical protein
LGGCSPLVATGGSGWAVGGGSGDASPGFWVGGGSADASGTLVRSGRGVAGSDWAGDARLVGAGLRDGGAVEKGVSGVAVTSVSDALNGSDGVKWSEGVNFDDGVNFEDGVNGFDAVGVAGCDRVRDGVAWREPVGHDAVA